MTTTIFDKNYNVVNIHMDNHAIAIGPNKIPMIDLGSGFDLNEINFPISKGQSLKIAVERRAQDFEYVNEPSNFIFTVYQVETIQTEQKMFAVHFSGSYGIIDGSASFEEVSKYFDKSNIFYLELISEVGGRTIDDISKVAWKSAPASEAIADKYERMKQFIADHGTHYARTVNYGSRFVVRARTRNKESSYSSKVGAALNAVGSTFKAGVELSQEHSQTLSSAELELSISISGKLVSTVSEQQSPIFGAVDVAGMMDLIKQLRDGKAKIISVPIRCDLESYKFRLSAYPKCREIYTEVYSSQPAESPYGVPSGTIISWIPKLSDCRLDDSGNVIEVIAPKGWIVCDANSDYNTDGLFLRGTTRYSDILSPLGGATSHTHGATGSAGGMIHAGQIGRGLDGGGDNFDHKHQIDVSVTRAEHVPPFRKVFYLIKI